MPLVKFNCDGRWAGTPGTSSVTVTAGAAVEVCSFIADRAVKAGKAELFTPEKPKAKPKAKKKPLPSPVVEADEEKAGPVAKEEKEEKPKRARKRKK